MRSVSVTLLTLLAGASALGAQDLRFDRRTGGYGALGFGGGNITLTCDAGCTGDQLSAPGAVLNLGRHVSQRARIELGLQYQNNNEFASNAFGASLGMAFYPVGNLHLRGAGSYQKASFEDATGSYDGKGFGFMVGAGYDLYVGRQTALTPYVTWSQASMSTIDVTAGGGAGSTTGGSLKSLHFGLAFTRSRGRFVCTTAAGHEVPLTHSNRTSFGSCLQEVERRYGNHRGYKG